MNFSFFVFLLLRTFSLVYVPSCAFKIRVRVRAMSAACTVRPCCHFVYGGLQTASWRRPDCACADRVVRPGETFCPSVQWKWASRRAVVRFRFPPRNAKRFSYGFRVRYQFQPCHFGKFLFPFADDQAKGTDLGTSQPGSDSRRSQKERGKKTAGSAETSNGHFLFQPEKRQGKKKPRASTVGFSPRISEFFISKKFSF